MNVSRFYFRSDDSWFVNEKHAAMTQFRLIIRLL